MPDNQPQTTGGNIGSIVSAGLPIVGQAVNAISQGVQNRAQRKWNEKMYNQQREDALSDWARTNEYNTPLAQMQRLREAGLNPHLVYGGGANSVSSPVRGTDVKSWSPQAPAFDFGQIVDQFFGTQQRQQNLQNQAAQKNYIDANTEGQLIKNAKEAKGLPYVEDQILAKLANMNANTNVLLNRDQREQLKTSKDLEYTTQKILESQSNTAKNGAEKQRIDQARKVLIQDEQIKKFISFQKSIGLDNDYSQVEWLIARAINDPDSAVDIINKYIQNMGKLATGGAQQTGKTIVETGKSIWNWLTGQ